MTETIEIGEVKKIDLEDVKVLFHKQGNPVDEAKMIQRLLDEGSNQYEIGDELNISQAQISKRLKLLTLPESILSKVSTGEMKWTTAYILTSLPKDKIDLLSADDKITLKEARSIVKDSKSVEMVEFSKTVNKYEPIILVLSKVKDKVSDKMKVHFDEVIRVLGESDKT